MTRTHVFRIIGLLSVAAFATPPAQGQQSSGSAALREAWTVTVAAGAFTYELADDNDFFLLAFRADRPLSQWVRFEVETSYSRPEVQTDSEGRFVPAPLLPAEHANLFTFTVGFQAKYALGPVEPYAGIAAGLFARYDDDSDGRRFQNSTVSFPFGVRVWLTDHLGIRGDFRFREDSHEVFTRSDREATAGVFWTF